MEYFNVCYRKLLFRCDMVHTIHKLDFTTFMIKLFATKISSFTIITRSCILGEKVLKMNDYLTYFGAEISNVQILCYFAFSFFKFWIIPSPSCNSFKCTRISKRNGTSLLWNSSRLFLRLTYPQTVLFLMREGSSKGTL